MWSLDDKKFLRLLEQGRTWEEYVAEELRDAGIPAQQEPLRFRDSIEEAEEFRDQTDICIHLPHREVRIEVKSRNLRFTSCEDFPYDPVFVTTVNSWEQASRKPHVFAFVSTKTGCILWLSAKTSELWQKRCFWDSVRSIQETFYTAPLAALHPFSTLVRILNSQMDRVHA